MRFVSFPFSFQFITRLAAVMPSLPSKTRAMTATQSTQYITKQPKQYERTKNCDSSRMRQAVKTRVGLGGGQFDDQFASLNCGFRAGILPGAGHFLRVLHHPAGLVG